MLKYFNFKIFFLLTQLLLFSFWHAYNESIKYQTKPGCLPYQDETKPLTTEYINRRKLWPGLMSTRDLRYGESLYGLKSSLELLFNHQNPSNCENKQFLISRSYPTGFGKQILILKCFSNILI